MKNSYNGDREYEERSAVENPVDSDRKKEEKDLEQRE